MMSPPPFSQNRGDIKYIKFEILQIVSPSEDVKFSNVRTLFKEIRYSDNMKCTLSKISPHCIMAIETKYIVTKYIPMKLHSTSCI